MRKKFLFNYLYIFVLSTLSRPSCCRARTVESTPSSGPDGNQNVGNEGQQAAQQQQKIAHSIQRRQVNNKQIQRGAYLLPIRRKRGFEDDSLSARYQHPSNKLGLVSGESRFKKPEESQEDDVDDGLAAPSGSFQSLKIDSKLNSNKGLASNSIYDDKSQIQTDQDDGSDKLTDDALKAASLYGARSNPMLLGIQSETNLRLNSPASDTNSQISGFKGKRDTHNGDAKSSVDAAESSNDKSGTKEDKRHTKEAEKSEAASGKNNVALAPQKQKTGIRENGKYGLADEASKLQRGDEVGIAGQIADAELDRGIEYEDDAEDESASLCESEPVYKRNIAVPSRIAVEDLEKLDVEQSASDEDADSKEVGKRDADGEDEYEEGEDQDSMGGGTYLVDGANNEERDARQGIELTNKKVKREDIRVKRDEGDKSTIAKESTVKKGDASAEYNNRNENAAQTGNSKEEGNDNSKREAKLDTELKANKIEGNEESKRDVASDKEAENEVKTKKEANDAVKREVAPNMEVKSDKKEDNDNLKRKVAPDMEAKADKKEEIGNLKGEAKDQGNENSKRDLKSDTKNKIEGEESGEISKNEAKVDAVESNIDKQEVNENAKRELRPVPETRTEKQEGTDNLKSDVKLDMEAKDEESDADYEKRVEQQIQQKIDSIKEEIKREVEQKQKIQEIEENNAKYDELQSREDEDEESQSLEAPNQSVSKRSIQQNLQAPIRRTKRHTVNGTKRSENANLRQLNEIERVDNLDPGVYERARLKHESIRKRSAPVYGDTDAEHDTPMKPPIKKRSVAKKVTLVYNLQKRNAKKRAARSSIIIPEQAYAKVEDELPSDLSLDPSLRLDTWDNDKKRLKRNSERYERHRRANAVVPEGRVSFLGYRPQDDDENDEGNEFDDDGFEDRTSNLQGKSYADNFSGQVQYQEDDGKVEDPNNFLFANHDQNGYLVRRKRFGGSYYETDEQPTAGQQVAFHGGGGQVHRQAQLKAKRMQTSRMTTALDGERERTKRSLEPVGETKSHYVASLVDSSQELTPQLATEYKEAFGGLQSDPGGALARFKRVKRVLHVS